MFSQSNKLIILVISLIFISCSSDEKKTTEPNTIDDIFISEVISIGEIKEEISQDIGSSGGTIVISNSESSLNGLSITVPPNGYNETRNFTISSAQIINHKLGQYFNPISPIISVNNGGGYSGTPMRIKIPIQKAEDEFAIGFLYNEITGEIEALPTVALDDSSITVETRHFALSSISSGLTLGKFAENGTIGNILISSIKESLLSSQTVINTGFTPGVDDWEFINFGSYIAAGGHCAGQSLTAMWYYYENALKEKHLSSIYSMILTMLISHDYFGRIIH